MKEPSEKKPAAATEELKTGHRDTRRKERKDEGGEKEEVSGHPVFHRRPTVAPFFFRLQPPIQLVFRLLELVGWGPPTDRDHKPSSSSFKTPPLPFCSLTHYLHPLGNTAA